MNSADAGLNEKRWAQQILKKNTMSLTMEVLHHLFDAARRVSIMFSILVSKVRIPTTRVLIKRRDCSRTQCFGNNVVFRNSAAYHRWNRRDLRHINSERMGSRRNSPDASSPILFCLEPLFACLQKRWEQFDISFGLHTRYTRSRCTGHNLIVAL